MSGKKRFLLRVDPELYDAIQRWAADEWRSVNGQIEYLLREALRRAGRLPPPKSRRSRQDSSRTAEDTTKEAPTGDTAGEEP